MLGAGSPNRRPLLLSTEGPNVSPRNVRTNVYVDGFNLYYRALRGTCLKWLNILTLCQSYYHTSSITRIRYFTARVQATPDDPDKPNRQELYLRALRTLPNLSVHLGRFTRYPRLMPLAACPDVKLEVIRTDEKGSDVNLASYLLVDGFNGEYDMAIVVSNDSDLTEPIRLVQNERSVGVGVLNPQSRPRQVARDLRNAVTPGLYQTIGGRALAACQFPDELTDARGTFHKPAVW